MDSRAIQKYGNADVTTNIGGRALSSQVPLLHALIRPMKVPNIKASNVVMPTRPSVHGRAWYTIASTDLPKLVVREMPKLKVVTCSQYVAYWEGRLWCVVPPSSARSEWSACGLRCGCSATRTCAGLPG